MEEKPKLKIKLSITDKVIEIIGWLFIVIIWTLVMKSYYLLPNTIPIHYNGIGKTDGFGNKSTIFILPVIATIVFIGLSILNQFPHVFNYPTPVTSFNAMKLYTDATKMIRFLKLNIVLVFGIIIFKTIKNAYGQTDGFGIWFLPIILGLIYIPILYFLIKMSKTNNTPTK